MPDYKYVVTLEAESEDEGLSMLAGSLDEIRFVQSLDEYIGDQK